MGRDKRDTEPTSDAADTGIATLRAQNGKMDSSSKGKREVLVENCRKLTPTATETFEAQFEKEINGWAEANVGASKRKARGLDGLQSEFTIEVNKCVAKLEK